MSEQPVSKERIGELFARLMTSTLVGGVELSVTEKAEISALLAEVLKHRRLADTADLDFEPDENHTVSDMVNIGYSLMREIHNNHPGYAWNETPAEVVVDLLNEIDELKRATVTPAVPQAEQAEAQKHLAAIKAELGNVGDCGKMVDRIAKLSNRVQNSVTFASCDLSADEAHEITATLEHFCLVVGAIANYEFDSKRVEHRAAEPPPASQWKPIETAPDNGTILICGGTFTHDSGDYADWPLDFVTIAHRKNRDSIWEDEPYQYEPEFWMPLPQSPASTKPEGGS